MKNKSSAMGMNKTGMQMSPVMGEEMVRISRERLDQGTSQGTLEKRLDGLDEMEKRYIENVGPIGSVPIPGTLKGVVKTGMEKLKGEEVEVFVDKLGERLAFERGGVRLYDAFIRKCQVMKVDASRMERIIHFRNEELEHFKLVHEAIEGLGADPTCQTPFADTNAVMSTGIMQVLADPRTSLPHCLQALLLAELGDHDGWELLVKLARGMGQDEMADKFTKALAEETTHLQEIRKWNEEIFLAKA